MGVEVQIKNQEEEVVVNGMDDHDEDDPAGEVDKLLLEAVIRQPIEDLLSEYQSVSDKDLQEVEVVGNYRMLEEEVVVLKDDRIVQFSVKVAEEGLEGLLYDYRKLLDVECNCRYQMVVVDEHLEHLEEEVGFGLSIKHIKDLVDSYHMSHVQKEVDHLPSTQI